MADSMRNSLTTVPFSAPRHFIVPISRKRSVTDMSMALAMPTVQVSSAMHTSHRSSGLPLAVASTLIPAERSSV